MALQDRFTLLLLVITSSLAAIASAELKPGSDFPYFDNCRRQQANQLRNVTALAREDLPDGNVQFCFRINVKDQKCTPEIFQQKRINITSRCCNTTFAKIKFYVNVDCKYQFLPSNLTVPLMPSLSKFVSPSWQYTDEDSLNWTSVKYTQFGPIPQSAVNGTLFCLKLRPPTGEAGSMCNITSLANITNPTVADEGIFQLAIYDRKTNNYECCPTFTFNTSAPAPPRRLRRHRRVARKLMARSWVSQLASWAGWQM